MWKVCWLLALGMIMGCEGESSGDGSTGGGRGGSAGSKASGGVSGVGGSSAGASGNGATGGSGGSAGSAGGGGMSGVGGAGGAGGGGSGAPGDSGTDGASGAQAYFVYTGSGNGTISIFKMDPQSGTLTANGTAAGGTNPSYLAWDPAHRFLFAVNEGSPGRVVAFSIDRTTGALQRLNDQSSSGNGPAFVSVDHTGKWVFVANYAANALGTAAVLPIGNDGQLGAPVDTESLGNNSLPHLIIASPDNGFAFVPCKGRDIVAQFRLDATTGMLEPNTPPTLGVAAQSGPRHLTFHPNGRFAYLVGELDSTLTALTYQNGTLSVIASQTTLPSGFSGTNTGADVRVHPNGRYVYASNRGHDSIAIFSIDGQTGRVTLVGHQPTQGRTPRNFHIDPTGAFLLAANQGSGTVVTFRIGSDGRLTPTGQSITVNAPAFVGVVTQPL